MLFPFLSGIQKASWELYRKKRKSSITLPTWCASAIKTKELFEELKQKLPKYIPQEE
jgi:hypothetical protein